MIKTILFSIACILLSQQVDAQILSGKIEYERRTNLEKMLISPQFKGFVNDKNKIQIEKCTLVFNDSSSVFEFIAPESTGGREDWMSRMTVKNSVYRANIHSSVLTSKMSIAGEDLYIKDTIVKRVWKITESTRKIAGYTCKQAVWEAAPGIKIYAWYSEDIVPEVGPESFTDLPGAVLGLATEDGGVTYFATKVSEEKVKVDLSVISSKQKWMTVEEMNNKYFKNTPIISPRVLYTW